MGRMRGKASETKKGKTMKGLVGHAKASGPQVLKSCQPRKVVIPFVFWTDASEMGRKKGGGRKDSARTVDGQPLQST